MAPLAGVAGAGMSAWGQFQGDRIAQKEIETQQHMEEYKRDVENLQAAQIEKVGEYQQNRQTEAAARQESTMINNAGGSGALPPLAVYAKQVSENELENRIIGYNYNIEAEKHRSLAGGYGMQAKLYKQRSQQAKDKIKMKLAMTALSGVSMLGGGMPVGGGYIGGDMSGLLKGFTGSGNK
jgi:hypothetical protein